MTTNKTNIKIADITLRECECETCSKLSFKEKQEIAKLLEKLDVDIIETGYMSETPGDAVFIRMLAGSLERCILSVPVAPTKESIDEAWTALSKAKAPRLNLIMPTSTIGMEYGYQLKAEAMLPLVAEYVAYAKTVSSDVEFTAEDAVRSDPEFLAEVIKAAINAGAGTITLSDLSGELLPDELGRFTESVLTAVPELRNITFAFHIKDKLGLASAAALSGISAGVNTLKVSARSNTETLSLENLLNILKIRGETLGISCSLNTVSYQRTCARLTMLTGVADTAVRRASAEDDSNKKRDTALPENTDIIGLRNYVQAIGYEISEDDLERIFTQYKDISRSKNVVADDIEALIAENAGQAPPTYTLKDYVITSGSAITATAYIEFEKDGAVNVALSAGDGPIDAAFKAAESVFGTGYELEEFQIHAVTGGRDATGDALVKLRYDGKLYSGRGVSTDIVGASLRAYLSAINKILYEV